MWRLRTRMWQECVARVGSRGVVKRFVTRVSEDGPVRPGLACCAVDWHWHVRCSKPSLGSRIEPELLVPKWALDRDVAADSPNGETIGARYPPAGDCMLPVANPKVIYKALLDGEAVLFSTEEEVYFGLNEVGARVWELLPPATNSLDDLCTALAVQYPDADPAMIRADVMELIAELTSHRLVIPHGSERTDEQSDETPTKAGHAESARVG